MTTISVTPSKGRWHVSGERDDYRWQYLAWFVARRKAKRMVAGGARSVEVLVYGEDGTFKRKDTYGYDPEATKG